jgi:hypothetical protein
MAGDVTTKLIFDIPNGSAEMNVYVDSVLVTHWFFQDGSEGIVTCDEKTESSSAPLEEAREALRDMNEWIRFIRNHNCYYHTFDAAKEDYSTEMARDDDGIECKFMVDGDDYRNCSWDAETDEITYGARPAINWSWGTFLAWHRMGEEFFRMIDDHKATE